MNTENDYRVVLFLFGIQHLSNFKIFQIWYHYRLVLQFCWISSLASYEQRTWLQIGLDFPWKFSNEQASTWRKTTLWFFVLRWKPLEPNISPLDKAYTLVLFFWDSWIDMFWKPLLLQIGFKKSEFMSHEDRKWLQSGFGVFLEISTWNFQEKNHYKLVFKFLGNQHQALQRAYSLVKILFDQNWMSTFQKSRSLQIGFLDIWVTTKWLHVTKQFWVKFGSLRFGSCFGG